MMVLKKLRILLHNKEELIEDELFFNAYFVISAVWKYYGHLSMMQKQKYKDDEGSFPKLNKKPILFRK
jgi:hypothetical protein